MHLQFFLDEAADLIEGRSLCGLQAPARLHDGVPAEPNRDRMAALSCCRLCASLCCTLYFRHTVLSSPLTIKPRVSTCAVLQVKVNMEVDKLRSFMPSVLYSLRLNSLPSYNLLRLVLQS